MQLTMKSRVITFCVFYICSVLVVSASNPYPQEPTSLSASNNGISNPLKLPSVARSRGSGYSGSPRELLGTKSFEQGNSNLEYPLQISRFSYPQGQGGSNPLNNLYDRSRFHKENNDYGKYLPQSQSSLSELTLQRELEKQQQAALQNRLANQFIETGGLNKFNSNRDISSDKSPPQIRQVSDSYVDSVPIETLLQKAKHVETIPIRAPIIHKTLPVSTSQPSGLLDKLRPTHLNSQKSASQGYDYTQEVNPIVFGKQEYRQVPQGNSGKIVTDDARTKEVLNEVEIAKTVGNSGYSGLVAERAGGIYNQQAKSEVEKVVSQSKATAQAYATSSQKGGNQKELPGSLREIFSQLHLNKEKPGPIPEILNGSGSTTHCSETEPTKPNTVPGSLTDIFSDLHLNQNKPGPIPEILNGSVSNTQHLNTGAAKPKANDKKKKRYLIIHPDGRREYVNTIDDLVKNNSNYILYTSKNVTQGIKAGLIPANNPPVLQTKVTANAISKATVAPISKKIPATKTNILPTKPTKVGSAVTVKTSSVSSTKQKLSSNETTINKIFIDGNIKKTSTTPKPTTNTPCSTTTTTEKTSTGKPDNSTHPITAYRVGHKDPSEKNWFETDLNDGGEDLFDKLSEGANTYGSVYVFQISVRPIIDRDTKKTIYPNGTIVEETIESVCDSETYEPKLVKKTTIVHPKDKRNLGDYSDRYERDNDEENNNGDREYNNDVKEDDSTKEDSSDKEDDNNDNKDTELDKKDTNDNDDCDENRDCNKTVN